MELTNLLIYLAFYIVIGIYHGGWALQEQARRHPNYIGGWRMILIYSIAVFLWPVTLPWAVINYFKK